MPRKPRHNAPGAVYHLISRFVDRDWFISSESERTCYLSLLGRALSMTDWRCISYGIMSNHLHLGMVAGEDALGMWIRRVHSPFADWLNRSHDRIGVIFVRGPKDILVPPHKVGPLIGYIHNNPVRAGVVTDASETTWTSHRAYVGLERAPSWLHVDEGLQRAGIVEASAFDAFVRTRPEDPSADDPTSGYEPEQYPSSQEDDESIDPEDVVRAAAHEVGLPVEELRSRRKQKAQVHARRLVARCADRLGVSGVDIAKALGTSQQCVSRILTRTRDSEQERGDMDRVLQRLATHDSSE